MKAQPNLMILAAAAVSIVGLSSPASATSFINGNLAAGYSGFSTDYTYTNVSGGLEPAGTFTISSTSGSLRPDGAWGNYTAPGGGNMMVVNASGDASDEFWDESVSVVAGQTYTVSFDAVNNYNVSAPDLALVVDGVAGTGQLIAPEGPYGTGFPSGEGPWAVYNYTFTAGTTGNETVGFADLNTDGTGNDFSVTDFAITAVPEPSTWLMLLLGFFGIGFAMRARGRRPDTPAIG